MFTTATKSKPSNRHGSDATPVFIQPKLSEPLSENSTQTAVDGAHEGFNERSTEISNMTFFPPSSGLASSATKTVNTFIQKQETPPQQTQTQPPSIQTIVSLPVPRTPAPDYSQSIDELGALEKADFIYTPQLFKRCDSITNNGIIMSFVRSAGIRLDNPRLEFFIASHILERARGRTGGSPNTTWITVRRRIETHAREHFAIYRRITDRFEREITLDLQSLPSQQNPTDVSQTVLETYVDSLLRYWIANLQYQLWFETCEWERTDYPNLNRIPNAFISLRPNCGNAPVRHIRPTLVQTP